MRARGAGEVVPGAGRDISDATHIRGNIVATSISSDVSTASGKPDDLDDLDAAGRIYTARPRLRALSGVTRVVVRVHSGASSPCVLGDMLYSVGVCRIGQRS